MGIIRERVRNMENLRSRISGPKAKVSATSIDASAYRKFNGFIIEERLFKRYILKNQDFSNDVKGRKLLFVSRKFFEPASNSYSVVKKEIGIN